MVKAASLEFTTCHSNQQAHVPIALLLPRFSSFIFSITKDVQPKYKKEYKKEIELSSYPIGLRCSYT
uniref:Casein kinase n=1 Tax=Rhizophora mucronata TaxID=61149 RepID=A0A2P2M2Q1_RHIMU